MFKPSFRIQTHANAAMLALVALLTLQAPPAWSQLAPAAAKAQQAQPRLATQLVMSLVTQESGADTLTSTAAVQPGDLLQYTAHYGNPTAAPMRDLVSSLPVPAGTQWVPGSEKPSGAMASVDGRQFGAMPLMRKQLQANGLWQQVPVPLAEIRYLRWPARSLAAGESFATSLRVRVQTGDAVNAALTPSATPSPNAPQMASR
jgi:hypothetical protein